MTKKATANARSTKNTSDVKVPKRKKRRKKSRYITGTYLSPKCPTPISYRSSWELAVCQHLDSSPDVLRYEYESTIIPYTSNKQSKKIRKYFPDFIVWYANGSVKMIEVKRENQLTNLRVQKKAEAAKIWCAQQNPKIIYEFWTDKIILPLKRMQKLQATVPKPRRFKK